MVGLLYSYFWPRYGDLLSVVSLGAFQFACLCLVAGVELWRGLPRGWWLSVIAQVPQMLAYATTTSAFRLQAGPQALLYAQGDRMGMWFGFRAGLDIGAQPPGNVYLILNLAPVLALGILVWARERRAPAPTIEIDATAPAA